jgi:hypothetical protein
MICNIWDMISSEICWGFQNTLKCVFSFSFPNFKVRAYWHFHHNILFSVIHIWNQLNWLSLELNER